MYLFTYGTLKKGGHFHPYLSINPNTEFIGNTILNGYRMYETAGGGFPFIREGDGVVHGELYKLDDSMEAVLDRVEGYPDLYDKRIVQVQCGGDDSTHEYDALVYLVTNKQLPNHVITPKPIESGKW